MSAYKFRLRLTMTGLAVYAVHKDYQRVGVLFPDARFVAKEEEWEKKNTHPDGTRGAPHACYLRTDLANVGLSEHAPVEPGEATDDGDNTPAWELLHQLEGDHVEFGFPASTAPRRDKHPDLRAPYTDRFANRRIELRPGLLDAEVASSVRDLVVCRTILHDGSLVPSDTDEDWAISKKLEDADAERHEFRGAGYRHWAREVVVAKPEDAVINVALRKFGAKTPHFTLPLRPVKGEIHIKIANLCADNPLEWNALKIRKAAEEDVDFKWHYHLYRPTGDIPWWELLKGRLLPVPRLVPKAGRSGDPDDCGPVTDSKSFAAV